jgi:hypothetical protein
LVNIDPLLLIPAPLNAAPKRMVLGSLHIISAYLLLFRRSVQEGII